MFKIYNEQKCVLSISINSYILANPTQQYHNSLNFKHWRSNTIYEKDCKIKFGNGCAFQTVIEMLLSCIVDTSSLFFTLFKYKA